MRRKITILLLAVLAVVTSCQRRPFSEHTTAVMMRFNIVTNVKSDVEVSNPVTFRLDLFDRQTGKTAYTDYLSAEGGYIYPRPGTYDFVVYNIDTESTIVRNQDEKATVEAYTNLIPDFLKSQMGAFLGSREEYHKQLAAVRGEASKSPITKDPVVEGTERIVNEPDYLYVGEIDALEIPAFDIDEPGEIVLDVDVSSVVETWSISVGTFEGLQWVSSITALITGQVASHYIGTRQKSEEVVTILFDMQKNDQEKRVKGYFNTFGKNPLYSSFLSLDLNIIDNAGNPHHYHFDLTDQFFDNEEYYLEVETPIVIEEPKVEGGGFQPIVDPWDEVKTEINL